jgi:hypothetical protein
VKKWHSYAGGDMMNDEEVNGIGRNENEKGIGEKDKKMFATVDGIGKDIGVRLEEFEAVGHRSKREVNDD